MVIGPAPQPVFGHVITPAPPLNQKTDALASASRFTGPAAAAANIVGTPPQPATAHLATPEVAPTIPVLAQ
jgi:hypothetical protein